jgi:site-specific recombinase XerD
VPAQQLELFPAPQSEDKTKEGRALTANSTLHRALEAYHARMQNQDLSIHTIRAFDSDLRLLARFLGARKLIGDISSTQLQDFLKYLQYERGVPCKPKSLARRLTTLKVFFSWLAAEGAIPTDPAASLVHRRVTTPLPHVLSEHAIAQLLAATANWQRHSDNPDARPHLLITLLLNTGIKKGECMSIALTDIDVSNPKTASVFIRYESIKQRHKERKLRLPAQFCAVLPEYLSQYTPGVKLFECTARNLEYVLDECEKRAGLPGRTVSFEVLRWTCAVRDLKQGMNEDALRRKLGLSHITWTETLEKLRRLTEPAL